MELAIITNDPVTFPCALSPPGGHPEGILSVMELLVAMPATVLVLPFNVDRYRFTTTAKVQDQKVKMHGEDMLTWDQISTRIPFLFLLRMTGLGTGLGAERSSD